MLWSRVRSALRAGSFLGVIALLGGTPQAGNAAVGFLEAHFDGAGGVEGLRGARALAVSPDGANVYLVSVIDDALATFSRDPATGVLTFVDAAFDGQNGVDGLEGAFGNFSIVVSPDGANVYVAASDDDSIAVFDRDAFTGELTFSELHRHGVAGVNALSGAWGVTVSRDGAHVYVAAFLSQAIAVFDRDPMTGTLSFVGAEFNNQGGVVGLDDP
jgi:DNA-binding beta-propeller fold protein YncE